MLIRSIIERKNGTNIVMDSTAYHFRPQPPFGHHVAEVANKDHIARLLAIREGYEVAETEQAAPEQSAPVEPVAATTPQEPVTPQPPEINGVDALAAVMAAGTHEDVSEAVAVAAFTHLFERAPNAKAKHETIVAKIIEEAAKAGLTNDE